MSYQLEMDADEAVALTWALGAAQRDARAALYAPELVRLMCAVMQLLGVVIVEELAGLAQRKVV